jgi:Ca2+-binding EF-hand superfamily protein
MMQGVPYLGEDWSVYAARYEPKSYVDAEDARRLIAFTELVDKADEGVFRQQIGSFIDVDQYLRFVAVQAALANLDSPLVTGHNYYLYLHPSTWRFMFMPWDLNEAFGGFFVAGRPEQQIDLSITHPFGGPNKLFERLTQVPELQTAYKQQFEELLAGPFSKEKLFADVEAVATMLRPALIEDKTIALEQFQQNLAEDTLTKAMSSDTRRRPPMGFRSGLPGAQRPDLKSGPIAAGPRGRPEGGGFPGMRMPKPPLKSFIAGRVASIQTQLEGKSPGYVPSARPFGPGGSGGPGGLGGPALGPVMVFSEAFMRVADADRDRELSSAEFSSAWKKLFEQCDTDKSGKLNVEKLRAGLAALLPPPPGFNGTLPDYDGLPPDEGMATSEAARPQQRPERTPGRVNEGPGFRPPRFGPQPGMRRDVPVVELARQIVRSADEDRDGALSSNELQKAAAEWFRDWDRDKSTALDLEELGEGWMKLLGPPPDFGPPQVHEASA